MRKRRQPWMMKPPLRLIAAGNAFLMPTRGNDGPRNGNDVPQSRNRPGTDQASGGEFRFDDAGDTRSPGGNRA